MFTISSQPVMGFWFCEWSNFAISHRKARSPLTRCLHYRAARDGSTHENRSLPSEKNEAQNVFWSENCMETRRNSGKTKTTDKTNISMLPSRQLLLKFCWGAFELWGLIINWPAVHVSRKRQLVQNCKDLDSTTIVYEKWPKRMWRGNAQGPYYDLCQE